MIVSDKTSEKHIIGAICFKAVSFSSTPPTALDSPMVGDSRITEDLTAILNEQAIQLASASGSGDDAMDDNRAATVL